MIRTVDSPRGNTGPAGQLAADGPTGKPADRLPSRRNYDGVVVDSEFRVTELAAVQFRPRCCPRSESRAFKIRSQLAPRIGHRQAE